MTVDYLYQKGLNYLETFCNEITEQIQQLLFPQNGLSTISMGKR
jgi:hypothetical protein